jgi:uncharacterized LabA/DUF88 family protein
MSSVPAGKKIAWVYIDGFNLYNGALIRTKNKWLNPLVLSKLLILPFYSVEKIKFFTAPVIARVTDPGQDVRQFNYWRALRTLGCVEIIEGQFKVRDKWLPDVAAMQKLNHDADAGVNVVGLTPSKSHVQKCEEKGTDVNLAAHLVNDAHLGRFDIGVVISNDSDLAQAINIARVDAGKTVGIFAPARHARLTEMRAAADFYRAIPPASYAACQFPDKFSDADGDIERPIEWT